MIVLGIHGGGTRESDLDPIGHTFHDASAVILKDGQIISAIEEERLSRIKHTNCFPARAIDHCLKACGCAIQEIDLIATNKTQHSADGIERVAFLDDPRYQGAPEGRAHLSALFEQVFGVSVSHKIRFCHHHLAHAWSAFAPAPFENSLILSIDGDGDNSSGMVLVGTNSKLTKLREFSLRQSLGHLYLTLIKLVGYGRFDEYKVMGLAPYGDPSTYADVFARCYSLLPGGDYVLQDAPAWLAEFEAAGLLKHARRFEQPFSRIHMDFSATLQDTLEKIVLHVLRYYRQQTHQHNLCLAGGVAHNCSLNGKIVYSGLFDRVFIQPAAHDAGGALGAAWWAHHSESPSSPRPKLSHVYTGTEIGCDDTIQEVLESWADFISFKRVDNVTRQTARLIADGYVIGWVQGRSEFGPRALGNRSILADPRPAENRRIINQMVKKREAYRPFAPSVIEEMIETYFEVPHGQKEFPFMLVVLKVRESARQLLGAVTHVDGTARVQSVSKDTNRLYWELINEFGQLTGIPVLLNTSFNNNAEPIVDSVDDSVRSFLTSGLHHLVVGNFIINKLDAQAFDVGSLHLAPDLPPYHKLVRRKVVYGPLGQYCDRFELEATKSRDFITPSVPISAEMFEILARSDARKDLETLADNSGIRSPDILQKLAAELLDLWRMRVVSVRPAVHRPRVGLCANI